MQNILCLFFASALFFAASVVNPLKAQTTQNPSDSLKSIPGDVLVILEKSCFGCHAEPGKTMAISRVNFTKWNVYSAEKQASKAKTMCNEVTKGKMPPNKFRENNPDAIPTPENLKILCSWVEAMQAGK